MSLQVQAMRYFPFHIQSYESDTRDLSLTEHGAYVKLMCEYYRTEAPLTTDVRQLCRQLTISRQTTVERLLSAFFERRDDGWHHKRIDRELDKFNSRKPHREAKRARNLSKQQRYREQRQRLVQSLVERDCVFPEGTSMQVLRAAAKKLGIHINGKEYDVHTGSAQKNPQGDTQTENPVTGPSRDQDKGSHNPLFKEENQKEVPSPVTPSATEVTERAERAAEITRDAGIPNTSASDAKLRQLIEAGATDKDWEVAAMQAKAMGKGWAWLLHRVEYRLGMRRSSEGGSA